jgi:crotonobetainyl-CoA:carnitine CoA-transferase CaiB-like acyl-CoA transferase
MISEVPGLGLSLVGLPLSFDGVRPPMRSAAPKLGEHNRELLAGPGDESG